MRQERSGGGEAPRPLSIVRKPSATSTSIAGIAGVDDAPPLLVDDERFLQPPAGKAEAVIRPSRREQDPLRLQDEARVPHSDAQDQTPGAARLDPRVEG